MLLNFPESMRNQPESLLAFKWGISMRKRMNWQQLRHQSLALRRGAYVGSRGRVAEACKISSAKAGIAPVNAHHVGKIEDREMPAPRTRERFEGKGKEGKSSKLPIRILMAATP
ncbi:module,Narbonolide/10-deoxymethynolide synthase PikA3 [Trichinella spiralis]|uniref:Module,Narbonolide/10-deoxymethynolide synthase PikA3 n=1 Tax=Trichinella spiralis TaxID=6334 RepID=A0ABR3KH56_TRISP